MNYGKLIYDLLSAGTYISFPNKVSPVTVPQGAPLPHIAYTKATEPINTIPGSNCIEQVSWNLYVFDDSPDDLDDTVQAIRKELAPANTTVPYTNDSMTVQSITYMGTDHEGYDKDLFGDGQGKYFAVVKYDFMVKTNIE